MMRVGIHQPNYLPGLSYFSKIFQSNTFVFLDSVQFIKRNWTNRNRVKSSNGDVMLTVPVFSKGRRYQKICEVVIDNNRDWRKKHFTTIVRNYKKAPYFDKYKGFIQNILSFDTNLLAEFNINAIKEICSMLDIRTTFLLSSELGETNFQSTDLLVFLTEAAGGDRYLSGPGGLKYLESEKFRKACILLELSKFAALTYRQQHGDFIPNLSIVDLLLNEGPNAINVLKASSKVEDW